MISCFRYDGIFRKGDLGDGKQARWLVLKKECFMVLDAVLVLYYVDPCGQQDSSSKVAEGDFD